MFEKDFEQETKIIEKSKKISIINTKKAKPKLKKSDFNSLNSPIKTRLNLKRQNLPKIPDAQLESQTINEPLVKKAKKINSLNKSLSEKPSQPITSLSQSHSTSSLSNNLITVEQVHKTNSFISNANICNLITNTGLSLQNSLESGPSLINTNPILWSSREICKYLEENKFDPNLVYLIEEHVIFFLIIPNINLSSMGLIFFS